MKKFFTVFVALWAGLASSRAADETNAIKSTPWHLMDAWWDIGTNAPFERFEIDVTISEDIAAPTRLYISPIGLGKLSGVSFYGGIQTRLDGNTKTDRRLRELGPGFIFSMWGERSLDAIRPSDGGFCQSSGHEGDFVSVRRPYEWKKGRYTYSIARMDRDETEKGISRWVGAFVYSQERRENIFVGALRFKGDDLVLDRHVANFVEIYGPVIPMEQIPKVTVTFGNLRVNGKPVANPKASVIYPKGVPDYANVAAENGNLVVEIGKPVSGRTKRQIILIGGTAEKE